MNFKTLIVAQPTNYGLTSAQASAYGALNDQYASALAACEPGMRSKAAVITKNQARTSLKNDARLLASIIQGQAGVTNAQKSQLGLNIRQKPSPIPAPTAAPSLDVTAVNAWTVSIRLHDSASGSKRGKPPGALGASVFSFAGPTPPADMSAWKFEGNVGRTTTDLTFSNTLAAGTKVWLTAFWFNGRKQSGPACAPVSINLQGGSVSMAA